MRREGRQHGIVSASSVRVTRVCHKPTNGSGRVSAKPHMGKYCRPECQCSRFHPAYKSKKTGKGMQKIRSASDMVSNGRLISWRVVDSGPGFKNSGFSAKGVLEYLEGDLDMGASYESEYNAYDDVDVGVDVDVDSGSRIVEIQEIEGENDQEDVVDEDLDDEEDDRMSFCEIGFIWGEIEGEESWCLVEEM